MEGNGSAPPDVILCGRCATACDLEDRFCRQCGLSLHESGLPSLWDEPQLPAVWKPSTSVIARGAAVVAAGTVAEILLRRLARGVFGRRSESKDGVTNEVVPVDANSASDDDEQYVSETLLLRRIRFRR